MVKALKEAGGDPTYTEYPGMGHGIWGKVYDSQDVYAWLRGAAPVPADHDNDVFAGLKAVCGRKDPQWNA